MKHNYFIVEKWKKKKNKWTVVKAQLIHAHALVLHLLLELIILLLNQSFQEGMTLNVLVERYLQETMQNNMFLDSFSVICLSMDVVHARFAEKNIDIYKCIYMYVYDF